MAVLTQKQDGDYIIRGPAYPTRGMCTWQVTPGGLERLRRAGVGIDKKVPQALFNELRTGGWIVTGGSGVGPPPHDEVSSPRRPQILSAVSQGPMPAQRSVVAPAPLAAPVTPLRDADEWMACPNCNSEVKTANYARHQRKMHADLSAPANQPGATASSPSAELARPSATGAAAAIGGAQPRQTLPPPTPTHTALSAAPDLAGSPTLHPPIVIRHDRHMGWSVYHALDGRPWGGFRYPPTQPVRCAICNELINVGWFAAAREGPSPHICAKHVTLQTND